MHDKSLSIVDCVQGYEYTLYSFLILLEIPPNDEHAVAFATCCHLLHAPDPLEPLHGPALGEDDKDLESVSDLSGVREVSHRARVTCHSQTHLDVTLGRACERIDDDLEDV